MANHAIMGIALAITEGEMDETVVQECVTRILCMNGLSLDEARDLAARPARPCRPADSAKPRQNSRSFPTACHWSCPALAE